PQAPPVPLAAAGGRRAADETAPPPPRRANARRRPRGLAVPRRLAGGQLGGAGGPVARQAHPADPGGPARRTHSSLAGGAQHARPDGPRDSVAAALRGTDRRRGSHGTRHRGVGRRQALLPRPQAPQGDPRHHARRTGGCLTWPPTVPSATSCSIGWRRRLPTATGAASGPPLRREPTRTPPRRTLTRAA